MTRPRIGITKPVSGDWLVFAALWLAVRLAGGRPTAISERHRRSPARIDGLLLSGGYDVNPHLYEGVADPKKRYDNGRDELEMAWARHCWEKQVPILAICRGCQLLNVSRGGDILQKIEPEILKTYPSGPIGYAFYRKCIEIIENSRLAKVTGRTVLNVNSLHRQAVRRTGKGLMISARESHGGIQAIEAEDDRFVLGVQFHPELLIHRAEMRAIFRAFVAASASTSH